MCEVSRIFLNKIYSVNECLKRNSIYGKPMQMNVFQTVSALHIQIYTHTTHTQTVTETHFRCTASLSLAWFSYHLLLNTRYTRATYVFETYSCVPHIRSGHRHTHNTFNHVTLHVTCARNRFEVSFICVCIRFSKMHCLFCVNAWLEIRNR